MVRGTRVAAWAVLIGLSGAAAFAQEPATDKAGVREGEHLALRICSACHVVSRKQIDPPIRRPPAPSFRSIANMPGTTALTLRKFIQTTHTTLKTPLTMPNPELLDDQVTAVVSYILSLRTRP